MVLSAVGNLDFFFAVLLGLAWPLASRLRLDHAEKIVASVALSVLGIFLIAWTIYVCALPLEWLWVLPATTAGGLWVNRQSLRNALSDPTAGRLVLAQLLVTLWSVGWLAATLSYSGGDWLADWFGHWQRAEFFLDRGPREILFNGFDPLTSRPPLANIFNGAWLVLTQRDFAHYQFFSTLVASLVFLPAGLFARRWGGERAIAVLAVLVMVSPMYVENSTYAWTKLPAAFFALTALYFFRRAHDRDGSTAHALLFAAFLASGLLTHYSTGPSALVLGFAWFVLGWPFRTNVRWWRMTAWAAGAGTLVLATWFGWSLAVFGLNGTVMTNTSITDQAPEAGVQAGVVLQNIRDTLLPHFMRSLDATSLAQTNPVGWWRDWFFQLYQVNLFFAFGVVSWAGILFLLVTKWQKYPPRVRWFWSAFVVGNVVLGIAVHASAHAWGLAHICLQSLVLLGLAFLAAQWPEVGRRWRLFLVAGLTVDFACGILLQFAGQAYALERWLSPQRSIFQVVATYSVPAQANFYAKVRNQWLFFGDGFIAHGMAVCGFLALVFTVALLAAKPNRAVSGSSP